MPNDPRELFAPAPYTGGETYSSGLTPEQSYLYELAMERDRKAAEAMQTPVTGQLLNGGQLQEGPRSAAARIQGEQAIQNFAGANPIPPPGPPPTPEVAPEVPGMSPGMYPGAPPPPQAPMYAEIPGATQSSMSYTTLPPEAQAEQEAANARAYQARLAGQTYSSERVALAKNTAMEASIQRQAMKAANEMGLEAASAHMAELESAYDQADLDLASMRVDPRKWEKETPMLTKALLLVGAGFFGYITKGRGPNPLIQLIDNAIDRDVRAQEVNISNKMKRGQMKIGAADKMGQLRTALTAAYYERAVHGLEAVMQNAQTEDAQLQAAMGHQELLARAEEAYGKNYDMYAQHHTVSKSTQVVPMQQMTGAQGVAVKEKWDDKAAKEDAMSTSAAIEEMGQLWEMYGKAGYGDKWTRMAGGVIGGKYSPITTDAGAYAQQVKPLGMLMAKGTLGFQISNQEGEAFTNRLPSLGDTDEVASKKMGMLISGLSNRMMKTYQSASPSDKARMAPMIKDGIKSILKFQSSNPQIMKHADKQTKKLLKGLLGGN